MADPHTTASGREACHGARDAYYACREREKEPQPAPAAGTAPAEAVSCAELRKTYEANCLRSWVRYWDERVRRGLPLLPTR